MEKIFKTFKSLILNTQTLVAIIFSLSFVLGSIIGSAAYNSYLNKKAADYEAVSSHINDPVVLGAAKEEESKKETNNNEIENIKSENTDRINTPPVTSPAPANYFPGRGTSNNKVGMYMRAEVDQIPEVAELVNSNGGAWGWVLIPFSVWDRGTDHWQAIFDQLRNHQLKPVIQLYTTEFGLDYLDFPGLATFLASLSWPTQYKYISVFNEVNAKYYWPGDTSPEEYAVVLNSAIDDFKKVDESFFMMPAGLNSSARNSDTYIDEVDFLARMNVKVPGIFQKLDGWATHAYPQPEFSGDIYNMPGHYGVRDQIKNYTWELGLLRNYGVSSLPVFITEAGWAHKEGSDNPMPQYLPASVTAERFRDAYVNHWLPDPNVVAIMPFVWKQDNAKHFNWVRDDGSYYPQYDVLKSIPKVIGSNE